MTQQIAVVNDPTSGVSDTDVQAMVAAVNKQIEGDFAPHWNEGAELGFVGPKPPGPGFWAIVLMGNSDQAGALGYHDLTPDGLPLGKVFAQTDLTYGQQVSVTFSHEVLEMIADPWINLCAQADDGRFFAWESADAVEADALGYEIDGIVVSDFVTPQWFGHGFGSMDFGNNLKQPFQLAPGGYISVFDPSTGQGWTQLEAAESFDPATVPKVGSRRERRFRGSSRWLCSSYR